MQKRGVKSKASVIPEPVPLGVALPNQTSKAREAALRKRAECKEQGIPYGKPRKKKEFQEVDDTFLGDDLNVDPEVQKIVGDTKFLNDILWVYKNWGGKEKMLKDIKDDQRMRKHFLKSILSLEVKKMELLVKKTAPNTGRGTPGIGAGAVPGTGQKNGNFFFILKGLEEEESIIKGIRSGDIDPTQLRQILDAEPGETPESEMKALDLDYNDNLEEEEVLVADDGTEIVEGNVG